METKFDRLRDNVAQKIANFALNHIATESYRAKVDMLIKLGMKTADEIGLRK